MKTDYKISPEEFVLAWETSNTVSEVVDKMKALAKTKNAPMMAKEIVLSRASSYRTLGVKLKKLKRKHGKPIDIAALNTLIGRLNLIKTDLVKSKAAV